MEGNGLFATQTRRWSSGKLTGVLSLVVIIGLAVVAIWWFTGGLQAFRDRPLEELLSYVDEINPEAMTGVVCSQSRGLCEEGWRTDVGDFQRFGSVGEAEYWETVLGDDGRRNGTVVLNMTDVDLSLDEKRLAVDVLFGDRDWN